MDPSSTQSLAGQEGWAEKIKQWHDSGLSMARWCRENRIKYSQFVYHKSKLLGAPRSGPKNSSCCFVELTDPPYLSSDSGITVECGEMRVILASNFDGDTFSRCIQALRKVK